MQAASALAGMDYAGRFAAVAAAAAAAGGGGGGGGGGFSPQTHLALGGYRPPSSAAGAAGAPVYFDDCFDGNSTPQHNYGRNDFMHPPPSSGPSSLHPNPYHYQQQHQQQHQNQQQHHHQKQHMQ